MTTERILWGMISFMLVVMFAFIKMWINNMSKTTDLLRCQLIKKSDVNICNDRHKHVDIEIKDLKHHKHAPVKNDGSGGEVIL